MESVWTALHDCVSELVAARGQLAELTYAVEDARVRAADASTESSVSGREQAGRLAAFPYSRDLTNTRCLVAQLEDQRAYLTLAIEHGIVVRAVPIIEPRT